MTVSATAAPTAVALKPVLFAVLARDAPGFFGDMSGYFLRCRDECGERLRRAPTRSSRTEAEASEDSF
ncbi:hypothetical protein GCM10022377_13290 [Zhihengliuella alba]|uniref:Uncharacterized protein n=1 Tax=Zhihengliuella alba TaxID=547018 RepID=A0ABP7D629_9MICC